MGAIGLTVTLCVCRGEAATPQTEQTPFQKQLEAVRRFDADAAAVSLRVDKDARDFNGGRVRQPEPRKLTAADIYPRRAFAVSAFEAAEKLQALETRLDQSLARAYEVASKAGSPASSAAELQTALLHYTVLLRRQSGQSWHTRVPGLVDDPACVGDIIGDQLLERYFSTLFSAAKDNRERSVFYLTEIARHTGCLGTAQAIQAARELTGAYTELEAFLRSVGRADLLPYVANVLAQPFLLFYDIDIYRARESDLYPWFSAHRAELVEGSKVRRMPVAWDLLWLYDRRTGRLVGFREKEQPNGPREVHIPAFFGSIVRIEQLGGGACSFSEMIQRGGDATSGYFCAGQSCARETTRNQGTVASLPSRNSVESLLKTRDGNFSANLACALGTSDRPDRGSAACPQAGGGGTGPDSAMLSCLTRTVARPGLEEMSCLSEATGFCSSPVDRIVKDMQMQQYSGVRIGRDCAISQGTIEGPIPVVKPKPSQAVKEARQQLQDIRNALNNLDDPIQRLTDAGVWDRLLQDRIEQRERQIDAVEDAISGMDDLIRETLQLMKEADEAGDAKERQRLSELADKRIEEQQKLRDLRDWLKESLERLKKNQEESGKKTGSEAGIVEEGDKRCVRDSETCGGNTCTAMASAIGQALQCVINRRKAAEAGDVHDPRGCTPELCDPMEPEGQAGRGAQCLTDLSADPSAAIAKQCWAVQCASGQVPTVGPGGACTCSPGEFMGSSSENPVGRMCEYMRCTGGDTAMVASMQGGSCGCAPEMGSGGVLQEKAIALLLPPVRSLLDLNPNVQEALLPLVPQREQEPSVGLPAERPPR
jgi:hypothetical protein